MPECLIPNLPFPTPTPVLRDCGESLVALRERDGFLCEPVYFRQGIPGALAELSVRAGVFERLRCAQALLPSGMRFLIFDAWRPLAVQKSLFDAYYRKICEEAPALSPEQKLERTRQFVSLPSEEPTLPPAHATGGAVDLTILDADGIPLPMGTAFDDFTRASNTVFFETSTQHAIRDNRRLLYAVMTQAGFTNLPTEWWHYDYGDGFWSFYTGQAAMYRAVAGSY